MKRFVWLMSGLMVVTLLLFGCSKKSGSEGAAGDEHDDHADAGHESAVDRYGSQAEDRSKRAFGRTPEGAEYRHYGDPMSVGRRGAGGVHGVQHCKGCSGGWEDGE